jgi:hypothetical protein
MVSKSIVKVLYPAGASGRSWTQTLSLGMTREVFYYCGMADGLKNQFLMFSHPGDNVGSWARTPGFKKTW